jgi:Zn ribbon nucleic-acid-binding protein
MNLEAIALRRSREDDDAGIWKRLDKVERPFVPRVVPKPGGKPVSCLCGQCRKCRNREYMAAWRGNRLVRRWCSECGKTRIRSDNASTWCGRCQQHRPAKFRRLMRSTYSHGGGI